MTRQYESDVEAWAAYLEDRYGTGNEYEGYWLESAASLITFAAGSGWVRKTEDQTMPENPWGDLPGMTKLTHKHFQAQVESLARSCGWLCYSTWNSRHSAPGFPDDVMVRPPRLLFVEFKIPPDKPTITQLMWLDWISKCGMAEVFLWTPDEWEQIVGELER
jgi:hypothetical protein